MTWKEIRMTKEAIRYLRTKRRLSQEKLAEAIGVTRQAVVKWESFLNASLPSLDNLVIMAHYFNIAISDLIVMEYK